MIEVATGTTEEIEDSYTMKKKAVVIIRNKTITNAVHDNAERLSCVFKSDSTLHVE